MKTRKHSRKVHIHRRYRPVYPNQASHDYYVQKALDITTGIVSGAGLILSLLIFANMM